MKIVLQIFGVGLGFLFLFLLGFILLQYDAIPYNYTITQGENTYSAKSTRLIADKSGCIYFKSNEGEDITLCGTYTMKATMQEEK